MKTIRLTAVSKSVPICNYVASIQTAKANPNQTFSHGLTCWHPCTGSEIVDQFRASLHERINRHIPGRAGRKWESNWFWEIYRAAKMLNTPRVAIHWLPVDLKSRFSHRLACG